MGFDRDVSFGEIFSCCQSAAYVSLPSAAPAGQFEEFESVECVLEFLLSSGLKLRGDETYYLGEKHENRTTGVRQKFIQSGRTV